MEEEAYIHKHTPGTYHQIFDQDGILISEQFSASSEDVEYEDSEGNPVESDFYAPFYSSIG